ncbi:hypothetical protein M422DRAFT_24856 [Sphaerobolus stellatus SS14]|nr:hypothetical protein M422DRAFT_24856 [Sphaerobolus stellatus SS14]
MISQQLTVEEINKAALAAVNALKAIGITSCLVGSSSCFGHGTTRVPNDVDLLAFSDNYTSENIKRLIIEQSASFYLTPPEGPPRPALPYLWYSLEGNPDQSGDISRTCRIDIIVGNTLSFAFPESKIVNASNTGLPLFPYIPALLSKVMAWALHIEESKNPEYNRIEKEMKASNDVRDIKEMLELDLEEKRKAGDGVNIDTVKEWLPDWFVDKSLKQVKLFVREFPETITGWHGVGIAT